VGALRPTLRTARLRLEPLTEDHVELLVELDSDPEVLEHIFGRALTREESVGTWAPKRLLTDGLGRGAWMGYDATGDWLGWWCLAVDADDDRAAELGYRLRRTAWGRGYATEGSRALLDHAFGELGLARVWAQTMAVNHRSRRVMEKLGMRHVRTDHGEWADPLPGAEQGEVVYEIGPTAPHGHTANGHRP
jgi:RimJ/RimL family protein N-acetyltransferase